MSYLEEKRKPYSKAIVKLLQSTVERNSVVWDDILSYQVEIQDYLSQIGLELIVKKDDGFAFVTQYEDSEGSTLGLIRRTPIGFETSIILVVLRQALEEFDSNPTQYQVAEKFITNAEIKEEVELFLPEKFNKVKLLRDLDNNIKKITDLGYLKEIETTNNETRYRIHRIIKEKVTVDILQEFNLKLQSYVESI